jgi:hypothetical protein
MKHDLPEPTLRDREQQTRPHSVHVSHQHAPAQHSSHEPYKAGFTTLATISIVRNVGLRIRSQITF